MKFDTEEDRQDFEELVTSTIEEMFEEKLSQKEQAHHAILAEIRDVIGVASNWDIVDKLTEIFQYNVQRENELQKLKENQSVVQVAAHDYHGEEVRKLELQVKDYKNLYYRHASTLKMIGDKLRMKAGESWEVCLDRVMDQKSNDYLASLIDKLRVALGINEDVELEMIINESVEAIDDWNRVDVEKQKLLDKIVQIKTMFKMSTNDDVVEKCQSIANNMKRLDDYNDFVPKLIRAYDEQLAHIVQAYERQSQIIKSIADNMNKVNIDSVRKSNAMSEFNRRKDSIKRMINDRMEK
jgi:adenylate kinase family enzyme